MKVLLIKPYADSHYLVPPLGLGDLVTTLRDAGHQAKMLHCVKENITFEALEQTVKAENPDVIGFQVVSCDLESTRKSVEIVRRALPRSLILVGGAHPSGNPENTMTFLPQVDFAFRGEAERSLVSFLEDYQQGGKHYQNIHDLIWRENGAVNPLRPFS